MKNRNLMKIASGMLALSLILPLAGCGSDSGSATTEKKDYNQTWTPEQKAAKTKHDREPGEN